MATTASWLSNRYEVSESTASGQDVLKRAKESRPLLAVDVSCSAAERAVYEARLTLLYRLLTTPSPITVPGRARRPPDSRAPLPLRRQRSRWEEGRVGKECVRTFRSWWGPAH